MTQETFTTVGTQTWTVPTNVESVIIEVWGADGEDVSGGDGGTGGYAKGTLSVTPGNSLELNVGGQNGTNGGGSGGSSTTSYPGGGGGGGTDVRQGGTTLSDRVIVAGGGGGEGHDGNAGGDGGASTGQDGVDDTAADGGDGGTQSAGGAGGASTAGSSLDGADGSLGVGGDGGGGSELGGAGGGGGYYGGGGGGGDDSDTFSHDVGGGGGGSNYVGGVTSTTSSRGVSASNSGDGKIVLTYLEAPTLDSVTVTNGDQLDVTFTDNSTSEDEYQILLSTDGGSSYSVEATVGPYTGTGQHTETTSSLLDGEQYTVKVRGVDGSITADSGTLTATTELPDVSDLSLDASVEDQFTASWTDVTDNGEYRIEHRETGASSWTSDGTVPESDTDIVISGLEDGEQYDVRVRSETAHVTGAWYSASDVTKLPAPTNLAADWAAPSTPDTIDATWTDESDNPDETFDLYYRETGSGNAFQAAGLSLGATATSGSITGLQAGTQYDVKVRVETSHVFAESSVDTATTGFDPAAGGWIALRDASGSTRKLAADLTGLEATREHTALSDWRAVVAYDEALEDWTFSETWVYDNTELLVRGEVIAVESTESTAETELQGFGELYRLEQIDTEVQWDSAYAYAAMNSVIVDETPFNANVTTPSSTSVSNIQIASVDGASELEAAAVDVAATDPVRFNSGDDKVELAQSGWIIEAEGPNASYTLMTGGGETNSDPSKYSGDTAIDSGTDAGGSLSISFDFTTRYDIPTTNLVAGFRIDIPHDVTGDFDVKLDGTVIGSFSNGQVTSSGMVNFSSGIDATAAGTTLSAGSHTLTWEVTDSNFANIQTIFDCAFLFDDRWGHTYPSSVSSGVLDAPELYPDEVYVEFQDYDSTYNLTSATLDTTWHLDSEGTVGLSYDSGGTWVGAGGTDTITRSTPSAPTTSVRPRVKLTRRTDDPNTSPASGDDTEAVFDFTIEIDGNTLGVIDEETFEGNVLQILQRLAERGDLRFVMEYSESGTSTIAVFKAGDVTGSTSSWVVRDRSRAVDVEGYANKVVVRGGEPDTGSRPKVTLQDDAEIAALGKTVTKSIKKPDITDVVSLRSVARTALASATAQDSLTGSLDIAPTMVDPGKSYQVPAWSATLPSERVRYGLRPGSLDGAVDFRVPEGLGSQLSELGRREQETRDAL